jgi:hypothetical protein
LTQIYHGEQNVYVFDLPRISWKLTLLTHFLYYINKFIYRMSDTANFAFATEVGETRAVQTSQRARGKRV